MRFLDIFKKKLEFILKAVNSDLEKRNMEEK